MLIKTPQCVFCNKTSEVEVTDEQSSMLRHPSRPHIQFIFPEWTAGEREMLISGTHPACWDEIFGEEEDCE